MDSPIINLKDGKLDGLCVALNIYTTLLTMNLPTDNKKITRRDLTAFQAVQRLSF
jgi:hypothetical protein